MMKQQWIEVETGMWQHDYYSDIDIIQENDRFAIYVEGSWSESCDTLDEAIDYAYDMIAEGKGFIANGELVIQMDAQKSWRHSELDIEISFNEDVYARQRII